MSKPSYKAWLVSFACAAALLIAVGGRSLVIPVLAAGALTLLITVIRNRLS